MTRSNSQSPRLDSVGPYGGRSYQGPWGGDGEQLGHRALGQRNPLTDRGRKKGWEGGPRRTKGDSATSAAAAGTLDESQWKSDPVLPQRNPESSCTQGGPTATARKARSSPSSSRAPSARLGPGPEPRAPFLRLD